MIKNITFLFFLAWATTASGQIDTSAYETQRLKINTLLQERSTKFGQYEASLNERTGIFGFQTKSDIKNSNEILRAITLNDNNIFSELKVLLDYKDLQVKQIQTSVSSNADRIQSYMVAIKRLQDQNQLLKAQIEKMESEGNLAWYVVTFLVLLFAGTVFFFYRKLKTNG